MKDTQIRNRHRRTRRQRSRFENKPVHLLQHFITHFLAISFGCMRKARGKHFVSGVASPPFGGSEITLNNPGIFFVEWGEDFEEVSKLSVFLSE